ncbi:transposase [Streptomyces syringium]|uniref:transposase n=1 Tax=Streptomyces syringium TaxID=76729 RepID=UPI0033E30D73
MSLLHHDVRREAFAVASHFRDDFFDSLPLRGDALFELTDALLCADGPMTTPVDLTLTAEHRRGHGAMYDALNSGNVDVPRLRQALAGLPQPEAADGRLVLAVDDTHWLRPDAPTSADRLFCHVYGRSGRSSDQFVPGWPYSFVAALESGRTSWCQILDALRLGPADDVAEVTAGQVRRVIEDLIDMGRWQAGDRDILIVFDAGYDAPRMAYLLEGLPVEVLGRMRTDRVMRKPVPVPWISPPQGGRPPKHGKELRFAKPDTWGEPDAATVQVTDRYGTARAMAWDRIHPRLTTRSAWIDHTSELPVIEGTLIRLEVDRLPGGHDPLPVWLWSSATGLGRSRVCSTCDGAGVWRSFPGCAVIVSRAITHQVATDPFGAPGSLSARDIDQVFSRAEMLMLIDRLCTHPWAHNNLFSGPAVLLMAHLAYGTPLTEPPPSAMARPRHLRARPPGPSTPGRGPTSSLLRTLRVALRHNIRRYGVRDLCRHAHPCANRALVPAGRVPVVLLRDHCRPH